MQKPAQQQSVRFAKKLISIHVETMKRRAALSERAGAVAGAGTRGDQEPQPLESDGCAGHGGASNDPVIMLSYGYSEARFVQKILAGGPELACTSGTGIVPLCFTAAETWQRVEGQDGQAMSRLAATAVRGLVTAQVTVILADAGKTRWCELATVAPSAAEPFLQIFPHTVFVCVHRDCLDVIRAGIQASPWGLQGQLLTPYLLSYPGNNVAALAAYWANSTEELLEFENANSRITHRFRYEDVITEPEKALTAFRVWLGLSSPSRITFPEQFDFPKPGTYVSHSAEAEAEVPLEMIPAPLRQRIGRLQAELGYPLIDKFPSIEQA